MGALSGKVKVPGGGRVPKTAAAIGLAITGYLIYRHRSQSAAAAPAPAAAAPGQYPPDGTTGNPADPYSTDPATGVTYGDEATGASLSPYGGMSGLGTAANSFPWDGIYNNPNDPYSMDSSSGLTYGNEGSAGLGGGGGAGGGAGGGVPGPPFSTDSQWTAYAIQQLTAVSGLDAGTVTDALGAYISGAPVTAAQEQVINDAIAVAGQVPVHGAGGYPPSINVSGAKTGGQSYAANPVTGISVKAGPASAAITWAPAAGATGYQIVNQEHSGAGARTSTVTGTSFTATGLKPKTEYSVRIRAEPMRSGVTAATATYKTT